MSSFNSSARGCIQAIGGLQEQLKIVSGIKSIFSEDCIKLVKLARRMGHFVEELESLSRLIPSPSSSSSRAVDDLLAALHKASELISNVTSMGPLYCLMSNDALTSEFTNVSISLSQSLGRLNLKDLNAPSDVERDLHMILSQMTNLRVDYEAAAKRSLALQDLRKASESYRVKEPAGAPPLSAYPPAVALIDGFTTKQLSNDLDFLKDQLELATKFTKWVDMFFFQQLIELLLAHVPSSKQQRQQIATQASGNTVVSTLKSPAKTEDEQDKDRVKDQLTDPVSEVKAILNSLNNLKAPIAIRLEGLAPLRAAAGMIPKVTGSHLHAGSLVFALSEPDCAKAIVTFLSNESDPTPAKSEFVDILLKTIGMGKSLNYESQQALMAASLPSTLSSLLMRSATPPEARRNFLSLLRCVITDSETNFTTADNNVALAVVKQLADVKLINGKFAATSYPRKLKPPPPPPPVSTYGRRPAAPPPPPPPEFLPFEEDIDQQVAWAALHILNDFASQQDAKLHPLLLQSGAVAALSCTVCNKSADSRVRIAAAHTLSYLMTDGAIAIQAAHSDVLVGLIDLMMSDDNESVAVSMDAIKSLLTPTSASPSTLAATQRRGTLALGSAPSAPLGEEVDKELLYEELGRALTPAATSALMGLIVLGPAVEGLIVDPKKMEEASDLVHNEWMKRNPKADYNAQQHVAYEKLPEEEKDKDRLHIRLMLQLAMDARDKNPALSQPLLSELKDKIIDDCAGQLHEEWRKARAAADGGKVVPRMKKTSAGQDVDINVSWSALHPEYKKENYEASLAAAAAVVKVFSPLPSAMGSRDMSELAFRLLPLSATDAACRAAILHYKDGLGASFLIDAAGKRDENALKTLAKIAEDPDLKRQVCIELARAAYAAGGDKEKAAALATAIGNIGKLDPRSEPDEKARERASRFAAEVVESGCLSVLIELAKSGADGSKAYLCLAGVTALRPLCLYATDEKVLEALSKEDVPSILIDCAKIQGSVGGQTDADEIFSVACEGLRGLCRFPKFRQLIFANFKGQLESPKQAARCCEALALVSGSNPDSYTDLEKMDIVPKLCLMISRGEGSVLAPTRLMCGLARFTPSYGPKALKEKADDALITAMKDGDMDTRIAAAAAAGFFARHDERWRRSLYDKNVMQSLLDIARRAPRSSLWWEEALVSLSVMAGLHHPASSDACYNMCLMLKKGNPGEVLAASVVLSYMARGAKGREAMLSDGTDLIELLINKALANGSPDAKYYAADAIGHFSVSSPVTLHDADGKAGHQYVPRSLSINLGSVEHLVAMLKVADDRLVGRACDALEVLCSSEDGVRAVGKWNGQEALQEVVARGKKGKVSQRTGVAAYEALMKCVGAGTMAGMQQSAKKGTMGTATPPKPTPTKATTKRVVEEEDDDDEEEEDEPPKKTAVKSTPTKSTSKKAVDEDDEEEEDEPPRKADAKSTPKPTPTKAVSSRRRDDDDDDDDD